MVPEYPPDSTGGGGIVFEALAHQYARLHTVTVIAGSTQRVIDGQPRDGVRIVRVPEVPTPKRASWLRTTLPPTPRGLVRMWRALGDVDVVHAHGFGFSMVDLGILMAWTRRVPVVQTLHGHPVSQDRHGLLLRTAFALYQRLGRYALHRSHSHTAVSEGVAEIFLRDYDVKPRIVPNGVELPPVEKWPELARIERPIVVGVGRLEWLKGFDTVIEALTQLPEPLVLALIGADNGEGSALREQAARLGVADRVHFLGVQPRGRVVAAYMAAAVVVMASRTEAFPGVPLEAMAAGAPLVATDLPGLRAFARDGVNSLLIPPDAPVELAEAVRRVLADGDLRRGLVAAGLSTTARFRWDVVAERYLDLMEAAMSDAYVRVPS